MNLDLVSELWVGRAVSGAGQKRLSAFPELWFWLTVPAVDVHRSGVMNGSCVVYFYGMIFSVLRITTERYSLSAHFERKTACGGILPASTLFCQ